MKLFIAILLLTPLYAIADAGVTANYLSLIPSSLPTVCNAGDLRYNSGAFNYCNGSNTWSAFSTASGTVTSVGLTAPAWLTVSGSPVTGSGTLAIAGTSETANYFLAAPNGSSGAMTPRAIVSADIPTLNQNTSGSAGSLSATFTNGVPLFGQGTGVPTVGSVTGSTTKVATSTGSITTGDCAKWDANGNIIDAGSACGSGSGGGGASSVLTKTSAYSILTTDASTYDLLLEANCSSACTMTLFAASNSGYRIRVINIGTATATVSTAGSDTFGSTADTTWTLIPGGSPQSSQSWISNGGSRWDGI